ncbi:MAG: glycosyltransferase [Candidatus Omnitrophota bacterium]|nr:glycosyltransferase [Candidatus Omnitrophota bacterium]
MNEPLITIIIPVKNAEKTIEKCIISLLNLDYSNYEITIVDDTSCDKTPEILKNYEQKIKLITNTLSLGPSTSRNIAALEAKGKYLAFTDADCIVDKYWLKELIAGFNMYPEVAACGGTQELPKDAVDFEKKVFLFMKKTGFISDYMRKPNAGLAYVSHNPSCNVMYRKNLFLATGGFLKGLWPGEDVELDYRLKRKGLELLFNPKAIVYHYRPDNLKNFGRMMFRYGLAQGFLVKKYGIFRKIQIIPFASSIFFIIILLSLLYNQLLIILTILLIFLLSLVYFSFNFNNLGLASLSFIFWNTGFLKGLCCKENH